MKRVIVFGATGTVGAYTALRLKEDGIEVIATESTYSSQVRKCALLYSSRMRIRFYPTARDSA